VTPGGGSGGRWPATLRSKPLTLRAVADLTGLKNSPPEWLAEAEQAVLGKAPGCALASLLATDSETRAGERVGYWIRVEHEGEEQAVGAVAASIEDGPEGAALVWRWLAVGARWRAFGYGGAAVPVVERAAAKLGATSARVRVPGSNGVALYFWLRLGYRPVAQGPEPGEPLPSVEGASEGTWMVRDQL